MVRRRMCGVLASSCTRCLWWVVLCVARSNTTTSHVLANQQGNLPFGKELSQCPRFMQFRKCVSSIGECGSQLGWDRFAELDHALERINWFFPRHMSRECLVSRDRPSAV